MIPYSQRSENSRLDEGGLSGGSFNYVRNSVKAVVDSYDGDVTFYVMDRQEDPEVERVETTTSGASRQAEFVVYLKQANANDEEEF